MKRKKRPRGRPRAIDPCIHLPNVTVRESILGKMQSLARETDTYLSRHIENALIEYLKKRNYNI
jgi:hypothetical protein